MTTTDDTGEGSFAVAEVPDAVAEATLARAEAAESKTKPGWLDRFVWNSLWKVVGVGLIVAVGLVVAFRVQDLLRMLVISVFFSLAMVPAVKYMHERWGWKRGAAVGVIYAGLLLFVVLMVLVLIGVFILLALVQIIPIIGSLAVFILTVMGIGALEHQFWQRYQTTSATT